MGTRIEVCVMTTAKKGNRKFFVSQNILSVLVLQDRGREVGQPALVESHEVEWSTST
jgi:hypothetical protein